MPKKISPVQKIIRQFTIDIVEVVREAILEDVEKVLAKHQGVQTAALPEPAPVKRLPAKPRVKQLKPRVHIKATAEGVEVLNA